MKIDTTNKLDRLIQYILLTAGEGDLGDRELGTIHLIKYVYLADFYYAKHHNGHSYTGITWKFHSFGPWSAECFQRIQPALESIGAEKKVFPSNEYEKDCERWYLRDDELFDQLYGAMDLTIAGSVQRFVRRFAADTEGLLHFVYNTEPMLRAAPGETLVLVSHEQLLSDEMTDNNESLTGPEPSARQVKKRKERLIEIKKNLRAKLNAKKHAPRFIPREPRYDEIYFEGMKQLEQLAGDPLEPFEGTAVFSVDVWKSKARFNPDVP